MMTLVTFGVPFCAGKERPRFARGRAYKTDAEKMREEALALAFQEAGGKCAPKGVPVIVDISAKMARKGHEGLAFTGKPDADNIAKLVLDALNGKAWHDDAQVVELGIRKLEYGPSDRIDVMVFWVSREE